MSVEFVVTPNGIVRRSITEDVIDSDRALETCFGSQGTLIGHIATATRNGAQAPIHYRSKGGYHYVAERISKLFLRTLFQVKEIDGAPTLVPVFFKRSGVDTSELLQLTSEWTPPGDMGLYFVSLMNVIGVRDLTHICYLAAFDLDQSRRPGNYILPLPNIYNDAKVCMGERWKTGSEGQITQAHRDTRSTLDRHGFAMKLFDASSWNADLLDEDRASKATGLFRFSGDGKQISASNDWTQFCARVGNDAFGWVYPFAKEEMPL